MRTTAKELKKWLKTINDNAEISVSTYRNNHEKSFIVATEWDDKGNPNEKEILVSNEEC